MSFQFLAIVRNGPDSSSIYRLAVDEELGEEMERSFTIAAGKWQDAAIQRVEFDPAYSLDDNQIFEIKKFLFPPDLLNAMRFPHECSEFSADTLGIANIKAIAAVNVQGGRHTAIFKTVGKAKKLEPTKSLLIVCQRSAYMKLNFPGIILDDKFTAVFEGDALLFRTPNTVKKIVSLKDYMKEANDLEIVTFLESRFETNTEKILAVADTWMRKRFASLMQSNVFDQHSAMDIYETAKSFSADIPMELSKDRSKLVLPEDKQYIRMMLKFLN